MIILHAIECECQECLDKWKKIESIEKKIGGKKRSLHWEKRQKNPKIEGRTKKIQER